MNTNHPTPAFDHEPPPYGSGYGPGGAVGPGNGNSGERMAEKHYGMKGGGPSSAGCTQYAQRRFRNVPRSAATWGRTFGGGGSGLDAARDLSSRIESGPASLRGA
jgi:hypothetical protein